MTLPLASLPRRAAASLRAIAARLGAEPSRRIGPYVVERKLGAGASSEVYRARAGAGPALALKLLSREASPRQAQRFEREARFGAALRHPNAAMIYERGEGADGTRYIAMELAEGETLQQLVERAGPLPVARAVRIARELCAALAHLHERGLVHRDIKPQNIIAQPGAQGGVKLIDFGLVEPIGAVLEPEVVAGTPLYVAPEALLAPGGVDARSDLYGLGGVMYFMLCGAPPFSGSSALEVCAQHLYAEPAAPSAALGRPLPRALERLVLQCLAKDPAARPPSAAAVAERLAVCFGSAERRAAVARRSAQRSASARADVLLYDARPETPG